MGGKVRASVSRPKVRTGCLTCKRVKCDERRPACLQCLMTKRVCEGYTSLRRNLSPLEHTFNDEERRALLFFRTRTVRRIFGEQDGKEWTDLFIQLGNAETPIKHAIVALASLHESIEPSNDCATIRRPLRQVSNAAQILALSHYNSAINLLTTESFDMSLRPDVSMLLCILFICFEQLRSGDAACLIHLTAGLKLLHWWRSYTNNYLKLKSFSRPTAELINERITPLVQRLRVQFGLCMDHRHTRKVIVQSRCLPCPVIPHSYQSLVVARRDFDRTMNYIFTTLETSSMQYEDDCAQALTALLGRWKNALDCSLFTKKSDAVESCTYQLLELYYHVCVVITNVFNAETETVFDNYTYQFQKIVDLADELIKGWDSLHQQYSLLFSFDLGITPPMFLVASRCRHPGIRRKALELMMQSTRYHGVWRDQYSGLCAQRIIELEEDGLSDALWDNFVPECRRIRKLSADLLEEHGQIVMQYVRSPFSATSQVHSTLIPIQP